MCHRGLFGGWSSCFLSCWGLAAAPFGGVNGPFKESLERPLERIIISYLRAHFVWGELPNRALPPQTERGSDYCASPWRGKSLPSPCSQRPSAKALFLTCLLASCEEGARPSSVAEELRNLLGQLRGFEGLGQKGDVVLRDLQLQLFVGDVSGHVEHLHLRV